MQLLFKVALVLLVAIPTVVALVADLGLVVMRATAHPPEDSPASRAITAHETWHESDEHNKSRCAGDGSAWRS